MVNELSVARDVVEQAGDIVRSYFGGDRVDTRSKGIGDVVTAADMASEAFILDCLRSAFPDDGVVGEEGANIRTRSGRVWYVDPLDGTLNFSRAIPIWCVSLALYEGNEPLVAAIRDPVVGETFSASVGAGSFCNGKRIHSSKVAAVSDAVVHITVDLKDLGDSAGLNDLVQLAPRTLRTRNIGSAALGLAYVSAGRFDAMVHRFANSWDYAAGVLLVRESGGEATALDGTPYTPNTRALCATAGPALHHDLLSAIHAAVEAPSH